VYEARALVAVDDAPSAQAQVITLGSEKRDLSNELGVLEHSSELASRIIATLRAIADTSSARFTLLEGTADPYETTVRLHRMVSFTGVPDRRMIHITASSESPEEAASIANVYAHEYQGYSQSMARASVAAARQFLQDQLQKRRADIRSVEASWESFAQSNDVMTDGQDGQRVAQEYVQLQTQRDGLQFQLEQEQRALAVLNAQLDQEKPSLRESVLQEQRLQSVRAEIQALEEQIAQLKTQAEQYYIVTPSLRGNEDRVPELADLKRRIDGFEARKLDLTEALVAASDEQIRAPETGGALGRVGSLQQRITEQEQVIGQVEAQIRGLDERIASYQGRIENLPRQTIQREQLERRLRQAEQFHNDIAMELQRTIIAEESELGYVQTMRTASVPTVPVRPNKKQNAVLGFLLGMALGVGLVFVRKATNSQLQEPREIPSHGYNLLGVIPHMGAEIKSAFNGNKTVDVDGRQLSTSLVPLLNPWSPITENYRLLRTNLKFVNVREVAENQDAPQVLMVTSPEPGDGKTTTAVNLALTLALSGRRVLLIDGDMRRPSVHKLLGISRSPGLAEMLVGQDAGHIVQHTFLNGLYVVPAGTPDSPPTELLDSERMRALIDLGRRRCDAIIVDSPPVLAASDPLVLGALCDATLVVASAGKTDVRALQQVKETLDGVEISVEGVIFNRYDVSKGNRAYRYGYDYSYDYSPAA
jgi:capsular exopolysaccharide synthesis family protein